MNNYEVGKAKKERQWINLIMKVQFNINKEFSINKLSYDYTDLSVEVEDKTLYVDFDVYTFTPTYHDDSMVILAMNFGKGLFFDDYALSGTLNEMYEEEGVDITEVTAEMLGKATKVNLDQWTVNMGEEVLPVSNFMIVDMIFMDKDNHPHCIAQKVLEEFNESDRCKNAII